MVPHAKNYLQLAQKAHSIPCTVSYPFHTLLYVSDGPSSRKYVFCLRRLSIAGKHPFDGKVAVSACLAAWHDALRTLGLYGSRRKESEASNALHKAPK